MNFKHEFPKMFGDFGDPPAPSGPGEKLHSRRVGEPPDTIIAALRTLNSTVHFKTPAALADAIRHKQPDGPEAARFLCEEAGTYPNDLAIDMLAVKLRRERHDGSADMRDGTTGVVVIMLPLPPHLLEGYSMDARVVAFSFDGHGLPHHLARRATIPVYGRGAEARSIAGLATHILFDAYADHRDGTIWIRPDVGEILAVAPPTIAISVHYRPRREPQDEVAPDYVRQRARRI